jgi:hypothetical protein
MGPWAASGNRALRLIKEGVETAVGDSQRIAQLTTTVFTAAFEPVKKRIEAVQNSARP